ncbi:MAG: hypothetical protein ACRDHO_14415, partial [Actinomycetota bacterium]
MYVGFALSDGRRKAILAEVAGAAPFLTLATLGLWWRIPLLLAVGFVGHAAWDALHHPRALDTRVRRWYVPLCLAYDVPLGVFILA